MATEQDKIRVMRELPIEWQRLMDLVERMKFGDMTITVQNGKPVLIKSLQQNLKLDSPDDFSVKLL